MNRRQASSRLTWLGTRALAGCQLSTADASAVGAGFKDARGDVLNCRMCCMHVRVCVRGGCWVCI